MMQFPALEILKADYKTDNHNIVEINFDFGEI